MLQLLGDQLIRHHRLAVFELVKNAYDADATEAVVTIDGIEGGDARILVSDNGVGMSLETVEHIWFVPGDDHKDKQRREKARSKRGRLPVGQKGVGRFAAHKLGDRIELVTRAKGQAEIVVTIDWRDFLKAKFLSSANVEVVERKPEIFRGRKTGTRIEISDLRSDWTRGEVRNLYRQITSMCSPFESIDDFTARLVIPERPDWLADLPSPEEIIDRAIWKFRFFADGKKFEWSYEFTPPSAVKVEARKKNGGDQEGDDKLLITERGVSRSDKIIADVGTFDGIGPVSGEFYAFDQEAAVLRQLGNPQILKTYLSENGGIRVYRDGIRVYNYGEADDDWLGMDLRRVNQPTLKLSRNIILGAINLNLEDSESLEEKTNREGFVENEAYERLLKVVLGALSKLETERQIDKDAMRRVMARPRDRETEKIRKPIERLRKAIVSKKLDSELGPVIDRLEKDYDELRQSMLQAGFSNMGLATVFHEIVHGVRSLYQNLEGGTDRSLLVTQAHELQTLLDSVSTLLRKGSRKKISIAELVKKSRDVSLIRFRTHRVRLVSPLIQEEQEDFQVMVPQQLFVGALTNILDNAFYWLRVRWPKKPDTVSKSERAIWIGRSDDFSAGPALVIADNGPGLEDDPEQLVQPFFTRRPEGMGLGLYYVSLACELSKAELVFPEKGDVDVPPEFSGAQIAIVFPKK